MFGPYTESSLDISVVIPVFNEEDNLVPLLEELEPVLKRTGKSYEVIFVDDRSTDSSMDVLKKIKASNPYVRIIPHLVNSGESASSATGIAHAKGAVIITIDADQQNDPADIPHMLEELKDDVSAICGVRRKRMDTIVKKISSRVANAFRNFITGDRISDAGCTFRAIRRSSLWQLQIFNGTHRFLPTLLRLQGYKVLETLVNDRPRTRGQSKYGIGNRMWRGILDCFAMRWFKKRCVRGDRVGKEI